jgi:hypothetical protein
MLPLGHKIKTQEEVNYGRLENSEKAGYFC